MNKNFKAFFLNKTNSKITHHIREIKFSDLMPGNVLVKVEYSSFNFKDGLAITGTLPVVKKYPMIPGVDFSGIVIESKHKKFKKNDSVILNGWGVGEKHYGGFAQYARVNGDWLIKMPQKLDFEKSMIIGSAGYTSALCVLTIINKIKDKKNNEILVTGASGGVGSIAVHLLAKLGYNVTALSGKDKDFLISLGAKQVLSRNDFKISKKPLESEKWTAAIDTVGGDILSTIISQIKYDGIVASTGLAKSHKLQTTVFPFILRNITLAGVDCVYADFKKRVKAWEFIADNVNFQILDEIKTVKTMADLPKLAESIMSGNIKGRTIINTNII
tara:strand:- start:366 stop:1355 length:990 start_codon:yes stop_codon:yes gene_type:complete